MLMLHLISVISCRVFNDVVYVCLSVCLSVCMYVCVFVVAKVNCSVPTTRDS